MNLKKTFRAMCNSEERHVARQQEKQVAADDLARKILDFVQKVTDVYLKNLPEDYVPYWDFNDPAIPDAPRDASAAAVVASALLELSTYLPGEKGREYKGAAIKMLKSLSSDKYQSRKSNPSFLLHSTGHWSAKSEIDASIIYADYYYMEALLRLKKLDEKENG